MLDGGFGEVRRGKIWIEKTEQEIQTSLIHFDILGGDTLSES